MHSIFSSSPGEVLSPDPSRQDHIFWHEGHPLSVNCTEQTEEIVIELSESFKYLVLAYLSSNRVTR